LYAPLILVAAVGLRWSWQRSPVLTSAALAFLLVRIAFYAPWWVWNGGAVWGPRFLVPAMPALAVPLLEVVRRLRAIHWSAIAAATIVAVLSLGVQVLGVTTRVDPLAVRRLAESPPQPNFAATAMSRATEDAMDDQMFDWGAFPIRIRFDQFWQGENGGRVFGDS
jgi:hypothetical protein